MVAAVCVLLPNLSTKRMQSERNCTSTTSDVGHTRRHEISRQKVLYTSQRKQEFGE